MFRIVFSLGIFALWTLFYIPLQWAFTKLDLPLQRTFPVIFSRFTLILLGVKVKRFGTLDARRPLLVCANHVSWLDMPILYSLFPLVLVSKVEVRSWPVFGILARLQRTIFLDRSRRSATKAATQDIAERLRQGEVVAIFPEGTTGNGSHILPFRSSLLGAAQHLLSIGAEKETYLQPVAIRYCGVHGLPIGRALQPYVAWYGDMDFMPHLLALLKLGALEVEVHLGTALVFSSAGDRKQTAKKVEQAVRDLRSRSFSKSPVAAKG